MRRGVASSADFIGGTQVIEDNDEPAGEVEGAATDVEAHTSGPFERVRAMLQSMAIDEEEDIDPFQRMLEVMTADLREEARQLREANDDEATRLGSQANIEERMRMWSAHTERRFLSRLHLNVTATLDQRVEGLKREMHQRSLGSTGGRIPNSGFAANAGDAPDVDRRWRNGPWTSGRASRLDRGPHREHTAVALGSTNRAWAPGSTVPPAGKPSPGRDMRGRLPTLPSPSSCS